MQPKLNNEGETPMQEKTEPKESKRKEKAEIKAYAASQKKAAPGRSMFDVKPGESLPHEHRFKN